jgi:alkylhydroperoxidase/carboxymuconolactone decarboxylase family protein YurZ
MTEHEDRLRGLAVSDRSFVRSVLGIDLDTAERAHLEPRTHALIRLGATLAVDTVPSACKASVEAALAAGASVDEIVGTVIAAAPTIGLARVAAAAPEIALSLGYDVDDALESS